MLEIHCENRFCIYWVDGISNCGRDAVFISSQGVCNGCTNIILDDKLLNRSRSYWLDQYKDLGYLD